MDLFSVEFFAKVVNLKVCFLDAFAKCGERFGLHVHPACPIPIVNLTEENVGRSVVRNFRELLNRALIELDEDGTLNDLEYPDTDRVAYNRREDSVTSTLSTRILR